MIIVSVAHDTGSTPRISLSPPCHGCDRPQHDITLAPQLAPLRLHFRPPLGVPGGDDNRHAQ